MTERPESRQWERRAHRRLTADARRTVKTMHRLEGTTLVWVDAVRQCVEDRLGIGPDDQRALDDPAYAAALERWFRLGQLAEEMEQVVRDLQASLSGDRAAEPQQEAER